MNFSLVKKYAPHIVPFTFLILTLVVSQDHEMWRDEAQKWLIASNLDFVQIFSALKYEGHPFIWYFLLHGLKLVGFSYKSVKILNWVILSLGVLIFFYKSPFQFWLKTFFIFSSLMAYEYAAISLNYGIVMALIFGLAWCYPSRHKYPLLYSILLFLLFNAHAMAFAFAGGLSVLFIIETFKSYRDGKHIVSVFLLVTASVILVVSLIKPADAAFGISHNPEISLRILLKGLTKIFDSSFWVFNINMPWYLGVFLVLGGLVSLKKVKYVLLVLASLVYYMIINEYFYGLSFRHYGFVFCFFLFCWWQSEEEKESKYQFPKLKKYYFILLSVLLFHASFFSIRQYQNELKYAYSGAESCSVFINQKLEQDSAILIGYPSHTFSAVLPYLSTTKQFWQPEVQRFGSYIKWDRRWISNYYLTTDEVLKRAEDEFGKRKNLYLVISKDYLRPTNSTYYQLQKLYSPLFTVYEKGDEDFYVFKLE